MASPLDFAHTDAPMFHPAHIQKRARCKQRAVIEFSLDIVIEGEKVPPAGSRRQMSAAYGDQCVGVSAQQDAGRGGSKAEPWGKGT